MNKLHLAIGEGVACQGAVLGHGPLSSAACVEEHAFLHTCLRCSSWRSSGLFVAILCARGLAAARMRIGGQRVHCFSGTTCAV